MNKKLIKITHRHNIEVNKLKSEIQNYTQELKQSYNIISNIELEWFDEFAIMKLKIAPPYNVLQEEIDAVINIDEKEINIAAELPVKIESIVPAVEPTIRKELIKVIEKVVEEK